MQIKRGCADGLWSLQGCAACFAAERRLPLFIFLRRDANLRFVNMPDQGGA